MGTQLPFPQRGTAPQFSVHICCRKVAGWIKMPLGTEVGLGPGHIVLDRDPAPKKKGHSSTQFLAHICCHEMAGWIKMPLGTEVSLVPGHIVLDGDPAPRPPKGTPPIFCPYLLWPNVWMDQDATWYGGRPRPRPHCATWGPSSPPPKGRSRPIFGRCLLAKRSPISAAAEHLLLKLLQ